MFRLFKVAHSGIPVVSQIGQGAANLGHALGQVLSPPTPQAPPTVVNPSDPNSDANAKMSSAAAAQDKNTPRGEESNMLDPDAQLRGQMYGSLMFGGSGDSSGADLGRATLMGV